MKNRRKVLLQGLAAASLCLLATGVKALSITSSEYEVGPVVNNSTFEISEVMNVKLTPVGIALFANPQVTGLAPSSGTLYGLEGELHHDNGQGGGGGGGNPGGSGPTGTVPDTGSTLMLLGTAMVGIAWARSKFPRI